MTTQTEIIEMARQAGAVEVDEVNPQCFIGDTAFALEGLEAFAKLVSAKATDEANIRSNAAWALMCKKMVADEREACAEIAEKQRYAMNICLTSNPVQNGTAVGIANQIRARGEVLASPIIESYLEKDNLEEDLYDLAIKADNWGQP